MMSKFRSLIVLSAVFVFVLVGTVAISSASSLDLRSPKGITATVVSRCANDPVVVVVDAGTAEFESPSACRGEEITLLVAGEQGVHTYSLIGEAVNQVSIDISPSKTAGALVAADT